MEPYSLRFKASVEKDLRRLPAPSRRRCIDRIVDLRTTPRPAGVRQVVGSLHTYRLRRGAYRVVYQVDDAERTVIIQYVRHRKDAYR